MFVGIGVYSSYIRVRTQEGVPVKSPTSIEVEAINSTSVRIQWDPPDAQFINGINQGYKIEAVQVSIKIRLWPLVISVI